MTFQSAIDYLYSRLPVFQNQGTRAYKPGLSGITGLCQLLGNPHEQFKCIHVGGTNGKGSTSHMLASVLQAAGYRVGLYTSPHLKSFTERIRVNGDEVVKKFVAEFVSQYANYINSHKPSFFEVTVAMAFDYFAAQEIDIAVVEVGMGGRLDSTNIITPEVSIITNIGWDHMQYLGDSLSLIAHEKAGIIKPEVPLVVSEMPAPEVLGVFKSTTRQMSSELILAANEYVVLSCVSNGYSQTVELRKTQDSSEYSFTLGLAGTYQIDNLKGVLCVLDILKKLGYNIELTAIESGLAHVAATTGLKGRWQILSSKPVVIADTAHNLDGLKRTIEQFCAITANRLHFVLGFVADKDVQKILSLFPIDASYYFCQPSVHRAMAVGELALKAEEVGLVGKIFRNVNEALSSAIENASEHDAIYVGGSTFVVADLEQI
ncbi:folylpolyglutamate synthase/dihydrofolate synthase family protein [Persicitalea sp.]|uniref:bifunctional folylpolyglutamate synthase/dihydrofolate synthase n=1 Tax=Persicitalea sp. TaxID=3100273 RepID=UPI0035947628